MTALSRHWRIFCLFTLYFCFTNPASADFHLDLSTRLLNQHASRIDGDALGAIHHGKLICSLAGAHLESCPTESAAAQAEPRVASNAKTDSVNIEVDQFSLQQFGQTGFSPQCLFVDQSSPQGYLERKIANTLLTAPNPIYEIATEKPWFVQPTEPDSYWQYYSDCDAWSVVFAHLPEPTPSAPAGWFSSAKIHLKKLKAIAAEGMESTVQFFRWMEFISIETQNVPEKPSLPVDDAIIDGLKSFRPVIEGLVDHPFIQNPYVWLTDRCNELERSISGTAFASVWDQFRQTQFLGRVAVRQNVEFGADEIGVPAEKGWMERFSWISKRIERVVEKIKMR